MQAWLQDLSLCHAVYSPLGFLWNNSSGVFAAVLRGDSSLHNLMDHLVRKQLAVPILPILALVTLWRYRTGKKGLGFWRREGVFCGNSKQLFFILFWQTKFVFILCQATLCKLFDSGCLDMSKGRTTTCLRRAWYTAGICFIRCTWDEEKMLVTHLVH